MQLVRPASEYLGSYVAALQQGWSPNSIHGRDAAAEELASIATEPAAFLATMEDREARGPLITLPDGSTVARIPGLRRWLWDGEFCGSIGLRWQPGSTELPPHCLGHIGYAVDLVGAVALAFSAKPKTRHKAPVVGMYVTRQPGAAARAAR